MKDNSILLFYFFSLIFIGPRSAPWWPPLGKPLGWITQRLRLLLPEGLRFDAEDTCCSFSSAVTHTCRHGRTLSPHNVDECLS